MLKKWTLACLLLLTTACSIRYPAYAADATPATPDSTIGQVKEPILAKALSLQECLALAEKNHADVLVGKNSVITAKSQLTQAKSAYFPELGVNAIGLNFTGGTITNPANATGAHFTVSQNIFDGMLREYSVSAKKADVVVAAKSLERTKQSVNYAVTGAYFTVLRNKKLIDVNKDQVAYLENQLIQVQERIKVGDAAKVDELPIKAQLANAKVDMLTAQNNVLTAAVALQQAMGLSPQADFDIQEVEPPVYNKPEAIDVYIKSAMLNRPDVAQAKATVLAAKAAVISAGINMYPRPVVSGSYDLPMLMSGSKNTLGITAGLAYNIFNGGSNKAAYKQAQAARDTANVQAAQIAKNIQAEIQNAYIALNNAYQRRDATEASLEAAQANLDAQTERNKQGLGIQLDLLNAQVQLTTAKSNAVQAKYDYYTAMAQLEYAIGKQGGLYGK